MGHVQEGDVTLLLQVEHQIEDPEPDRDVEHRDRLVGEDHRRLDREGPGDRHTLPLAAGELVRILLRDLVRRHEPDRREQLLHTRAHVPPGHEAVDQERPRDVVVNTLDRVQRRERILEDHLHLRAVADERAPPPDLADVLAAEENPPFRRLVEPGDEARDGALTAAALADERGHAPRPELEGDVVDSAQDPAPHERRAAEGEVLRQALHFDRRAAHRRSSARWQATRWSGAIGRSSGRSLNWRA